MKTIPREHRAAVLRGLAVALSALGFAVGNAHALAGNNGPHIGDTPPPLSLGDVVQGPAMGEISWPSLRGKVVVLEFWDTGCGPCIQAIPHWNELVDRFASRPVVFLGISDDNKDVLHAFLKRKPIKGWLALDQVFQPTHAAFDVLGIPHTVIVDATGRIAAITHPANLDTEHLEEILAGQPSSLPMPEPYTPGAASGPTEVSRSAPVSVEVSLEGPLPPPTGAFNFCYWEKPDHQFTARMAFLRHALPDFFRVSRHLIFGSEKLPDGLYDITATAPPDKLTELRARLVEALATKLGIVVQLHAREVDVYTMTVCDSDAPALKPTSGKHLGGGSRGGFVVHGADLKIIARVFEDILDRPVVDETNLPGLWDADIKWEMSPAELDGGPADPANVMRAAREQLGLELKRAHREMPVLVVEMHPVQ